MSNISTFKKSNTFLYWIIGFQLFRFCLLPFMGLMPQDAYYYMYGQNLDFSYFDHPGMIGYLLRLFTDIFGKSVFVLKLADFTITSLTLLAFYKLASYFLSKSKLNIALVLITPTVLISILSFNSTPDVPLLLFWTSSIIFLYKAIFKEEKWSWIFAGVCIGLAFNSKYTSILLQIGLLLFLLFSKRHRKSFLSPYLWLCLIVAILVSLPVLWWNYQHDFASFSFQVNSRDDFIHGKSSFLKQFMGTIGHQILLVLPILFFIIVNFTIKYLKRFILSFKLPNDKILFLLAFFIPTFLGFLSLTTIYWVKINWLIPCYISGIILASIFIKPKHLKIHLIMSVIIHLALAGQILFNFVPIKSDDTWVGWKELALEMNKLQKKYPNTFIFSEDNYKTTAALDFYTSEKVYAQNIINLRALQYDYLNDDLTLLNGKDALFLDSDTQFRNKDKISSYHPFIDNYFDDVKELTPITIKINGDEVRKFWVFYCRNYQYKK